MSSYWMASTRRRKIPKIRWWSKKRHKLRDQFSTWMRTRFTAPGMPEWTDEQLRRCPSFDQSKLDYSTAPKIAEKR